ncbi:cyp41 [Symbiodinium sp. CCMP2592]|nr:cyp41 [Symbiodinium sp. CCMP2592]
MSPGPITQSAGTGLGIVGDGKGWSGGSTRPDGEANQPQRIKENRAKVFLEVELHKRKLGRIVLELFGDVVPKTAENFRCLCTGERGVSAVSGKPLSYKGSRFHKIIPGKIIQGGDFTKGDGSGGDSIFNQDGDGTFGCENFKLKHDRPGLVSMAHKRGEEGKQSSQFFFTSKAEPKLDGKHVVFGRVIEGIDKLSKLESMGTKGGTPLFEAVICDCGELESEALRTRKRKAEEIPLPPGWKKKESRSKEPLLPRHAAHVPKVEKPGAGQTAFAFAVFIVVRSFHPIIIDISKTDGKLPYGKATPCVINSAVDIVIGGMVAEPPNPGPTGPKGSSAECAVLEFQMQSLKEELRDYDEQLPCWSAELAAAEEWAQQVDSEADAAEAEHRQLTEELSEMRLTSISPASSACEKDFEAAVGHHQKMGIAHDDFDEPLPIPPSTSDGHNLDEHRRHVDRHLQQEVSRRKLAVAHLRQQHLVSADQALAAGRKEAEELREALELAEREGQELARQRQVAEEQELPLREWVQHVEGQVNAARKENLRLSAALNSSLAFRASLLSDDAEAQPLRDSGMNVQQVRWLREHEQSCLARKAQLKEEIAAEEKRREDFLKEAWQHRAIAEERHRRMGGTGNLPNILQTPEVRRAPATSTPGSLLGSPKILRPETSRSWLSARIPPVPSRTAGASGCASVSASPFVSRAPMSEPGESPLAMDRSFSSRRSPVEIDDILSEDEQPDYWDSGNSLAFLLGGMPGLKQCWDPTPLKVFSSIAVIYAFGDFLEMQSMSVMGGAAYQILLQSKLLVTALIMWFLRGQRQTTLQWNVLVTIALGMSAFVLADDSSEAV